MTNVPYNDNEPLIDVSTTIRTLWEKKSVILTTTLFLVGCALAYILLAKPTYTAKAVILIDPRDAKPTKSVSVLEGIGSDSAAIASQVAVMKSTKLLKRVFKQQRSIKIIKLGTKRSVFSNLVVLVTTPKAPKILNPDELDLKERLAFSKFQKNVSIYREGLTYVLNVSYKSKDPDKAARVANAIVDNYISGQMSQRSNASEEVTSLLNDRIHFLREAVNSAEKNVADFKKKKGIINVGSGQTILNTRLEQLNNEWLSAKAIARDQVNKYQQAKLLSDSSVNSLQMADLLTSVSARRLRQSYNRRLTALEKAKISLLKGHPARIALQAEVNHLEKLIKKEKKSILSRIRAAKELAESNVKAVKKELNQLQKQSEEFNGFSIRLRQLQRTADASRTILEQFLSRAKETSNMSQLQRSNIQILSRAMPPLKPSWPKPTLTLLVATLLGLLSGTILALSPAIRQ